MKQQPRYVFSTVKCTHIYIAIQRACFSPVHSLLNVPCSLMYVLDTVIKHITGHVASRPQPVGSLPLAQNA